MPRWLVWSLVAIALWGAWGLIGPAVPEVDVWFMTAMSGAGVVAVALPLLLSPRLRAGTQLGRGFAWAFATGIFGNLGNLTQLMALKAGEASLVYPYTALYPLVTVIVAWAFLRERLNAVQGAGFVAAIAAIALLSYAGGGPDSGKRGLHWIPWATVTVLAFGLAAVTQKVATRYISNELSLVGFAAAYVPVTLLILLLSGPYPWSHPGRTWFLIALYGSGIGLGTLTLFAAYRHGPAAVVTAITGLYPGVTAVLAIPIFGESFGWLKGVAIVAALAAGTALTYEGKKPDA